MSDPISSDDDAELPPLTEFESNILAMRQELAELSNSVFHLQRTNQEIREEFDSDPELATVITENETVIARHHVRIHKLSKELAHFEALQLHRGPAPTAIPAPPSNEHVLNGKSGAKSSSATESNEIFL